MTASRDTTGIVVAYNVTALTLDPSPGTRVVVVHNDQSLDPAHPSCAGFDHVFAPGNVGFGRAVNLALDRVTTRRVVLVNPDVLIGADQWRSLELADDDEIVTLPQVDAFGRPASSVNRYPTAAAVGLTALRVGRWFPRGSKRRATLSRVLGTWGRAHADSMKQEPATYPLATHWASASVLSIATERLRAVGGFDERYFLYFEDTDLARRLAARFPSMQVRIARCTSPVRHDVGGSAETNSQRRAVARARSASAAEYSKGERGWQWRFAQQLAMLTAQ